MKRKAVLILSSIILLTSFLLLISKIQLIKASEIGFVDEYILFEKAYLMDSIGTISVKKSLMIGEQKNYLYPTFDDNDIAFNKIKIEASNILSELSEINNEEYLCEENWEAYYSSINYLKNTAFDNEKDLLIMFFDIYQGQYLNEEIVMCVNNESTIDEKERELFYLLPYNSPYVIERANEQNNGIATYAGFNISDAISYAVSYSNNPNTLSYAYFDADCTNFASQIMENGGIEQEDSVQYPWVGWWHVRDGNANYQSRTWTLANDFARYFGVDYSSTSHFHFSANVEPGVFILLDVGSNGTWNHVGFAVNADNYLTDGYYDYMVAQHSDNYLAWTSTDKNHWEEKEAEGCTYGIIIP